jgi:hypothetical protein
MGVRETRSASARALKTVNDATLDPPCHTQNLLLNARTETVAASSNAVSLHSKKIWTADRNECSELALIVEQARRLFLIAHELFASHVEEHGC